MGHSVSEATVRKYRIRKRNPPSQTWRTFLDNHLTDIVAIDFFTVPTATFRVLFAFVVMRHDRRQVVHFNVTAHPTAAWTAQQVVEAFPDDTAPWFLIRDRDAIYGSAFQQRLRATLEAPCAVRLGEQDGKEARHDGFRRCAEANLHVGHAIYQ